MSSQDMQWLEITLNVSADQLDIISAQLISNGVPGLSVEDEADFQKFLAENRQYWDFVDDELMEKMRGLCRIKFYITDDEDGQKQLAQYMEGLDIPYDSTALLEHDWAYSWQKYYRPMAIGQRLYIVPEWEQDAPIPDGRVRLLLNPGLTFGTGSHASTQLCLQGVEQYTKEGGTVLDLGCGSGILSIAALVLGAKHAVALDIDPKAVGVAYENAALSGIGKGRYLVRAGNVLSDKTLVAEISAQRYQLILANIVADVIIPLAPLARTLLEPEGIFICSGIIDERCDEVKIALEQAGLSVIEKKEQDGWVSFVCQ